MWYGTGDAGFGNRVTEAVGLDNRIKRSFLYIHEERADTFVNLVILV